ncbi:trans-sulfuration enzyme family protein [Amycolatopsis aidingensis]|uniref:trans-sulfuration enzyme family protein n=1 Tax=Amycolatopsis aidingensis TaxID=2842453 RepID=UPI001C0B0C24|nr:PLP-dependent aspartate aminotransferase family protein [Amycolatopsis aidingensis]
MSTADWSPRTRAITAGRPQGPSAPMNVPIAPASALGLGYSREHGTETWAAFEDAIGQLEGGTAVAFASGMAAISAVFDLLPAGAEVAVPSYSYVGSRDLLGYAERNGRLRGRRIEPADTAGWVAAAAEVDLLLVESPTNPTLDLMDIAAVAEAARAHGARLAVDNTFATPLGQQPLAMGADLVLHSATKLIGGHSDLLLGLVVSGEAELAVALREARTRGGATPGVLESWLALRGLRTLPVRLAAASETATLLAGRLAAHPAVRAVRHPPGNMIAFELADAATADAFCAALSLIQHATSLGGVESSLERRAARPAEGHVPAGMLRFSVGLEDPEDLWRELESALDEVDGARNSGSVARS